MRALDFDPSIIRFTPPEEFNDPFDCRPALTLNPRAFRANVATDRRKFFDAHVAPERYLKFVAQNPNTPATFASFKEAIFDGSEASIDHTILSFGDVKSAWTQLYLELLKGVGVLCLCRNGHSPAMWAYYAEKQKGFLVEYDSTDSSIAAFSPAQGPSNMVDVRYEKNRPQFEYTSREGPAEMFRDKSEEWKHEEEVRCIVLLKDLPNVIADKNGTRGLVRISATAIKSVTAGFFAERSTVDALNLSLAKSECSHVLKRHAVADPIHFRINSEAGFVV